MYKRPDIGTLIARIAGDMESAIDGVDAKLRRKLLSIIRNSLAGAVHGLYGYIEDLSNLLLIDKTDIEGLNRWGVILRLPRKLAGAATKTISFSGTDGAVIQAGALLQRADGFQYLTKGDVTVSGKTASVLITASVAGTDGNCESNTVLTLVSPITGVEPEVTLPEAIINGVDIEEVETYRKRILDRIALVLNGGNEAVYEEWAKEVPGVTRAWCKPKVNGAGTVGIYIVCDNQEGSIIPDTDKINEVKDYIEEHEDPVTGEIIGRPVTADVYILAPVAVTQDFEIQLYPATDAVKAVVTAEIDDMLEKNAAPGGMTKISHIREAISRAEGETDHVLISPTGNIARSAGEITVRGHIKWS